MLILYYDKLDLRASVDLLTKSVMQKFGTIDLKETQLFKNVLFKHAPTDPFNDV